MDGMLNVGLMWIRATPATQALARVAEARTWAGWEQLVLHEELNYNATFATIFDTSDSLVVSCRKTHRPSSRTLRRR